MQGFGLAFKMPGTILPPAFSLVTNQRAVLDWTYIAKALLVTLQWIGSKKPLKTRVTEKKGWIYTHKKDQSSKGLLGS